MSSLNMHEGYTGLLLVVILVALAFDYVNGFHDAANAIATVVSTRALSPRQALMMAAAMNFAGAFWSENVAKTMENGLVVPQMIGNERVLLAALLGALLWNLLTWWLGLPSSSSHALVGGMIGAVVYHTRSLTSGVEWQGIFKKVIAPGLASPILAIFVGYLLTLSLVWMLHYLQVTPALMNRRFRFAQRFSAALMAFSHGTVDAQKVMGVITLALVTSGVRDASAGIPAWVKIACATMIALGTSVGGWKIIRTMGGKIFKLEPIHGFASDITSSLLLQISAHFGFPLSTTHVITGAIMGVGASKRISAVRWGVAKKILAAWVFTLPISALVGAGCCWAIETLF
jgi:PiT family inorganic phosphate transporter